MVDLRRENTMDLVYRSGKEIADANLSSPASFLTHMKAETIDTNPDRLCFILKENMPMLRVANGDVKQYRVRQSFIDTLLKWNHLTRGHLTKASNETAVSFFNDLLLAIPDSVVRIHIENGTVRTLSSKRRRLRKGSRRIAPRMIGEHGRRSFFYPFACRRRKRGGMRAK